MTGPLGVGLNWVSIIITNEASTKWVPVRRKNPALLYWSGEGGEGATATAGRTGSDRRVVRVFFLGLGFLMHGPGKVKPVHL
jgi:hypothetical protein